LRLAFADRAWDDYLYWCGDEPNVQSRLNNLITIVGAVLFGVWASPSRDGATFMDGGHGESIPKIALSTESRTVPKTEPLRSPNADLTTGPPARMLLFEDLMPRPV
jgi:hypothetical protein